MEGFDLDALQAQLMSVQEEETVYRLSERNCVDILQKLKALELITVVYTLDGKEYLTPERIETEVYREVCEHGGRVSLQDVQTLMNVDIVYVQEAADAIIAKDKDVHMLGGELISKQYLDSMADAIDDSIKEKQQTSVGELSMEFALPVNFMTTAIKQRLGTHIHGNFDNVSIRFHGFMCAG